MSMRDINKKFKGEIFKFVPKCNKRYAVSNYGRVFSVMRRAPKELKSSLSKKGYPRVKIYYNAINKKTIPVHRLVGLCFLKNPLRKKQINHKNGIKKDNRAVNLEWATGHENMQHAFKNGLKKAKRGEENNNAKLSLKKVLKIKKLLKNKTVTDVAKIMKITINHVSLIKTKRIWNHIK